MSDARWILTDQEAGHFEWDWQLPASQMPGAPLEAAIHKQTLRGGLSDGVDVIRIHNGRFEFSVLPTRGMGVWKGWLGDLECGWGSPVQGPVHPSYVPLTEPSGLGWLDGFDEWICRCGLGNNGAPDFDEHGRLIAPLHGRIANLPANFVEVWVDDDTLNVRGVVEETRFHFNKLRLTTTYTTRFNEPGFTVVDEVTNLSESPSKAQMLYHSNFGMPMLEPGSKVTLAAAEIAPRDEEAAKDLNAWNEFGAPTPGKPEQVYFFRLHADAQDQTEVMLETADASKAASMRWNVQQLPCFTLWKNEVSVADGYVAGLEPATNFPNPVSFEHEHDRAIDLEGQAAYRMELSVQLHDEVESIEETRARITSLARNGDPIVHKTPRPEWSA